MDSDENVLLEKHEEIIETYVYTLNTVLEWLESCEGNSKFDNYIIASSYLITVSHFQDSFIQLIHGTMEHYSEFNWEDKPKFIKNIFSKIVKEHCDKFDVVKFVSEYQNTFHDFFKDTANIELLSRDEKFVSHFKNFYKLNTNKYKNLPDKLKSIADINLDNSIKLETYEGILEKRNIYAHNKISSNLSSTGAKIEIKSFLEGSENWLTKISEELIKKCKKNMTQIES